jgi:predicted nucleic acid-binding protein
LIFVDSNIPMYLVGAPHPHKADSKLLLERLIADGQRLVTGRRSIAALDTREAIEPALETILDIVDDAFPVEKADVMRAAEIAQHRGKFSARDALHLAIMQRMQVKSILRFDAYFDRWPGLMRIHQI